MLLGRLQSVICVAKFNNMVVQQQLYRVLLDLCCAEDVESRGYGLEILALSSAERMFDLGTNSFIADSLTHGG
jgi:hypothetical protein